MIKNTDEKWFVMSDGKGAFNACFQMHRDGKVIGEGAALSGVSQAEAVAHVERAIRTNAERDAKLALVDWLFNRDNWKLPTMRAETDSLKLANEMADAFAFFCGGAEVRPLAGGRYSVGSLGYYHYVGA